MATIVKSFAIQGIDGYRVDIEVTTLDGPQNLSIIGLGDLAIKEAGERIQAAMDACGYAFPKKKVIISLAPGDVKKRGSHFDLPMAIALLEQTQVITIPHLDEYGMIGELALNGTLRPCTGILPMIMSAKENGIHKIIVPIENLREAKLIHEIEVYGFRTLTQVVDFLKGKKIPSIAPEVEALEDDIPQTLLDFSDVRSQDDLIDAIVLAAAGGHNMLMVGTPGCGKTMVAQRIPTILPEMTEEESLEVTKIHSIAGLLKNGHNLIKKRPFRAPHHNVSLNALIGGGVNATPGEVSFAHNGVLFLDELPEFSKRTLDALRQPIEDKRVCVSRVNGSNTYPSNFMFITAMNPCPCGYYPSSRCRCTDYEIIKYRSRISGPIMDRIDIQKEVHPVDFFSLEDSSVTRSSEELRQKVKRARSIQHKRYEGMPGVNSNAQLTTSLIQKYCKLDEKTTALLKMNCEKYGYSARVVHKLLRLARTSADLDGVLDIRFCDVERVLDCRELDKSNNDMMVVS